MGSGPMRIVRGVEKLVPMASLIRLQGRRPVGPELTTWVVVTDIVFVDESGAYTIGQGFMTDLASAPWFVSWFVDPLSYQWIDAGVIHDAGYAELAPSRAVADRWWREAASSSGASQFGAWASWVALRLFGRPAWRSNRRRLAAEGPRWRYLA